MSIKERASVEATGLFLPSSTFYTGDSIDSAKRSARKRWYGRLHTHFNRFKGTKGNVSDELSGSAGGEVE